MEYTSCKVVLTAALIPGIDRIDFHVTIDNQARDHRLQIQIPSGIRTETSEAEDVFHVTERRIKPEIPAVWAEYPQSTHPVHGFVSLEDQREGLGVFAPGISEFEGAEGEKTCLNLTLLRCVGWLSRTDLLSREGNGGWTIETPDAQCIGRHEYQFSMAYYEGSWRENTVYQVLSGAHRPAAFFQTGKVCGPIKNELGFLSKLPPNVRLSTLKPAEDGNGIVFRVYSIGKKTQKILLDLPKNVKDVLVVNLAEEEPESLPVTEGRLEIFIAPAQIMTIKLRR